MTLNLSWPIAVVIISLCITQIEATIKHGKSRGVHNAYITFCSILSWLFILAWGGFFK